MIDKEEVESWQWDVELVPDTVFQDISDAAIGEYKGENYISISEPIKHDQVGLQLSYTGTYHDREDNELFEFVLESGINRGTVLVEIARPEIGVNVPEITSTIYRYWVKDENSLVALNKLKSAWDYWCDQSRKMSYDKAFSPTNSINKHYANNANSIGGTIISFSGTDDLLLNGFNA